MVSWLAFAAAVALRPRPIEYRAWIDVGLYDLPFLFGALACAHRARGGGPDRRAWWAMAVGLALFTAANCYASIVVGEREIYPSPADGLWLAFYACAYASIVLLARSRSRPLTGAMWLDGAIAGTGAAALVAVFALDPVLRLTDGAFAEVVTNIAYPVADVLLIVVVVTAGYALAARDAAWWALGTGLAVMCVGDIVFLFQEAADTYQEGSLIDLSWPLAAALLGVAAAVRSPVGDTRPVTERSFVVPGCFTATSIGLLALAGNRISMTVGLFAAATLALAALRTALTVRQVSALAQSRIEARTDELTGLANRRQLLEALDARSAADAPTALVLIDLDRFKVVNDSLGHGAGDRLLLRLAERLRAELPGELTLARLGGDEFAVVLEHADMDAAAVVARRCRDALALPVVIDDIELSIDASIGIATSGTHARSPDELLANADVAMYRAKRQRTGVEVFSEAERSMSRHALTLLADLRAALADHTLDLHYQPRVDLRSGDVDGVEALLRWQHPEFGWLAPADFLSLVVEADLGGALLEFVADRSARDLRRLRQLGVDGLRMSINVFPDDLRGSSLMTTLTRHYDGDGLSFADLTVEVTEEAFAGPLDRCSVIDDIRARGGSVSIDDFGTGHASLSRLRELPLDELKLDRSFLDGVPDDRDSTAIVNATVALAHALDLPIVAEGVETAAAMQWLRAAGCDVAQGFHIARPMPFDALVAWLADRPTAPGGGRDIGRDVGAADVGGARVIAATPPG